MESTKPTSSHLNNQAVELLAQKRVLAAAKLFQKAFDTFRADSSNERKKETDGDHPPRTNDKPNPSFGALPYDTLHLDLVQLSSAFSPNNVFPLCPCAFLLPSETTSHLHENCTAAILIYNLALAHYCVGLLRMKNDLVLKAQHLNNMARSILSGEQLVAIRFTSDGASNHLLVILQLALEVNAGHLFFHFAEYDNALNCQGSLLSSLQKVRTYPDVWMFFFAATFHLEQFGLPTLASQA